MMTTIQTTTFFQCSKISAFLCLKALKIVFIVLGKCVCLSVDGSLEYLHPYATGNGVLATEKNYTGMSEGV